MCPGLDAPWSLWFGAMPQTEVWHCSQRLRSTAEFDCGGSHSDAVLAGQFDGRVRDVSGRRSRDDDVLLRRARLRRVRPAHAPVHRTVGRAARRGIGRGAVRAGRARSRHDRRREPRPRAGTGVFVARGTAWRIDDAAGLDVLSVLVREPLPANGTTHALVSVEGERGGATAGREFRLLATPEVGCASVTQFVGYIPVGRAPDHFHTYDEVVYVLDGDGRAAHRRREPAAAPGHVRAPAGAARPLARERRPRRDGGARRLPSRGLARRGLLPRRHRGRRPDRGELMPRIERTAEVVWEGNVARGDRHDLRRHRRLHRARVLAGRRGSAPPRARRARRSCSRQRTAAASRCRSRAS